MLVQRASIDEGIAKLSGIVDKLAAARIEIRDRRKDACRRVNESIRTFFVRVVEDTDTNEIDALVDQVKVGTRLQRETREAVRDNLDRVRLLEVAIRAAQDRDDLGPDHDELADQDAIAREAAEREKLDELAQLACLWPSDQLLVFQKTNGQPKPFHELTEGMKALAIKEISFAASSRPVISDQPEDAIPTRAVFDSLVPTLRRQRADRQFIVVSHDANVVVAGDMERVWILQGDQALEPYCGTLFEEEARQAALEHLEGGARAFELRRSRYARFST